jgi:hypothetical protein
LIKRKLILLSSAGKNDPQFLVYLQDGPTGLEFAVPRSCLPAHMAAKADPVANEYPGEKLEFEFNNSTPAGVFLYAHALTFGRILFYFVQGAWAGFVERHKELEGDSWVNFLLAGLVVAKEADDSWFERLIVEELVKVTGEALCSEAMEGVEGGEQ